MTTIFELLAEQEIPRLKRYVGGYTEHVDCPRCGGGSSRERGSLSVTIHDDAKGAVWICHRGTCDWRGSVFLREQQSRYQRAHTKEQAEEARHKRWRDQPRADTDNRPDWFWEFWDARHIGKATLDHFEVHAGQHYFPVFGGNHACLVFPYRWGRGVVGAKYRAHPEKHPMAQDTGMPAVFYHADSLKWSDGGPGQQIVDTVLIGEGEPDCLALYEAAPSDRRYRIGIVSLKEGAPKEATFKPDDKRFAALATHAKELAQVGKFIICTDTDGPGEALAEELARRLGRHKCRRWTLPPDCKDACDVLVKTEGKAETLWQCVQQAQPYPLEGVRRIPDDHLETLHAKPPLATLTTGTPCVDVMFHPPTEGRLIVVTGTPSHGKSTWLRHLMMHTIQHHARKWLVFAGEDDFDQFAIECCEMYAGAPFRSPQMTRELRMTANKLLADYVYFVEYDSEENPPTIDDIARRVAELTRAWGVTDLLIDPWNELEHQRGEQSETDYIARALQRFKSLCKRHGINVWLIAHPAKPLPLRNGDKAKPPRGYDISGSANWNNKADIGLTIWKDGPGESRLILWKSRTKRWGVSGTEVGMFFDANTNRYLDPLPQAEPPPQDDQPARWNRGEN